MRISRRTFLKKTGAAAATTIAAPYIWPRGAWAQSTVKVGILHSLTGTIAIAEASVVDAEKLAIEEINASGGVMGRKIETIVEDGASDWPTFAEKARKLLDRDKVAAIMGCYTSASRKATLPVVERSKGLLYYPTYYEGLAVSEEEASGIGAENLEGFHSCMGYFQSLKGGPNDKFVKAFKAKYGANRVVGDTLECGYISVYLWKMATEKAKSFEVPAVVAASSELEIDAPEGKVKFHKTNHHLWKHARIGAFKKDGQIEMIYESPLIEPNPFPKI